MADSPTGQATESDSNDGPKQTAQRPYIDGDSAAILGETKVKRPTTGLTARNFTRLVGGQALTAIAVNFWRVVISSWAAGVLAASPDAFGFFSQWILLDAAIIFVLPLLICAGWAGSLADRMPRHRLLITVTAAEVLVASLAVIAITTGSQPLILTSLALLGAQTAFHETAKYAVIPNIVDIGDISRANAWLESTRMLSFAFATWLGLSLAPDSMADMALPVILLVLTSTAALFAIRGMTKAEAPADRPKMAPLPFVGLLEGWKLSLRGRDITTTIFALGWCWLLAAMYASISAGFGEWLLQLEDLAADGLLHGALADGVISGKSYIGAAGIGLAIGTMTCGYWSYRRVELGLMPWGAIGVICGSLMMAGEPAQENMVWIVMATGFAGGFVLIPLQSLLQARSRDNERGRIIALSLFVNMIMGAIGLYLGHLAIHTWQVSLPMMFVIMALLTAMMLISALRIVPIFVVRFILFALIRAVYRLKVFNEENMPRKGGVLIVANHISYVDPFLIGMATQRHPKFLQRRGMFNWPGATWLFKIVNTIPIEASEDPEKVEASLERARDELRKGHVVAIFAEGTISRHGQMLLFKRGVERIMAELPDIPIVPAYVGHIWGSIFSFKGGRFFTKLPRRPWTSASITFGEPVPHDTPAWKLRQIIQTLGSEEPGRMRHSTDVLGIRAIKALRRDRFRNRVWSARDDKHKWRGGWILEQAIMMAYILRRTRSESRVVGVFLPACKENLLVNLAITIAGKVAVNLSILDSQASIDEARQRSGISTLVTTRSMKSRIDTRHFRRTVYVEDLLMMPRWFHRFWASVASWTVPASLLVALFGRGFRVSEDDAAVCWNHDDVNRHAGAILTHHAIISAVESGDQVFNLAPGHVIMTALPYHTAASLILNLWLPLLTGAEIAFHDEMLDPDRFGNTIEDNQVHFMIGTPDLYRSLATTATPQQMTHLHWAFVGGGAFEDGEKQAIEEKLDIQILEGWASDEIAPCISLNIPNFEIPERNRVQLGSKEGSMGHPLPGVAVRCLDPDTGEVLPIDHAGRLQVRSATRFRLYAGAAQRSEDIITDDGWFDTGLTAVIDKDGFIHVDRDKGEAAIKPEQERRDDDEPENDLR